MPLNPAEIHDAFDPAKHYTRIRRRDAADSYLTGQDENEADSITLRQIRNIGAGVFRDGAIIAAAGITLDANTGACALEAGKIAYGGLVREPAAANLTVPTVGELTVGLWIATRLVDETTDAALIFNPPGTSFPASGSPMSPREQQLAQWGLSTENHPNTADVTYAYVAVYRIKDGVVIREQATRGPWADDLERYDREAHGSYSVTGMQVTALGKTGSDQIFSIAAGTINAWGRKVTRAYDIRHAQTEAPPIRAIQGEHKTYVDAAGSCVVTVNNKPISSVQRVEILKERTVALTKGLANTMDALPDASVSSIVSVTQGATTYVATTDYALSADKVSWAPAGSEPAPGSSYNVTYRYFAVVAPTAVGTDTITVTGAVNGSQVTLDYSYKVRRIDSLAIEASGDLTYTLGPVNHLAPQPPARSAQGLTLATIDNDWINTPVVTNVAPPAVPFTELAARGASLDDLRAIVSRLALQVALGADQASSRDRQFVDPMLDDGQRDLGIAQTGAVAGGMLRLPITVSASHLTLANAVTPAIAYTRIRTREGGDGDVVVGGDVRRGVMRIAETVDPRITGTGVVASDTLLLARKVASPDGTSVATRTPWQAYGSSARMRAQTLHATVTGVTPAATIATLKINGVTTAPTGGAANGAGVSTFSFTTPANEPVGGKLIEVVYTDGTTATTIWGVGVAYTAFVSTNIRFRIPATGEWIGRVQLQVADVNGTEPIYWAISEGLADPDLPFRNFGSLIADGLAPVTGLNDGDWITLDLPPIAGRDSDLVLHLTSASPHRLKTIAADDTAYGNLLTSGRTLCHRIDAATMTVGAATIALGTVAVVGVTDLTIAADTWQSVLGAQTVNPPTFTLSFGGETYTISAGDTIPLNAPFTGDVAISVNVRALPRYNNKAGAFNLLWPRVALITGIIQTAGTYISRAMTAVSAQTVSAFLTVLLDPDATIAVDVQDSGGAWVAMTQASATPLGNGWYDMRFNKAAFTSTAPRLRITIGGDVTKRVYVDNLRATSF